MIENNKRIAEKQATDWTEVNKLPHFKIITIPCLDDLAQCWKNWGFSKTPSGLVNNFSIVYNNNKSFELIASIITNNTGFSPVLEFKVNWNKTNVNLTNQYSFEKKYEIYFFKNNTKAEIYIKNIDDKIGIKIGELTNFNINSSDLSFVKGFIEKIEEISNPELNNPFITLITAKCDADPASWNWENSVRSCFNTWGTGNYSDNPFVNLMYNEDKFYLFATFNNRGREFILTIYYDNASKNKVLNGTYKTTESYEIKIIQNTKETKFYIRNIKETNYSLIGTFNNLNIDKSNKLIVPTKFFTEIIK